MRAVYDEPRYYEIAFSYRDIAAEVDTFELCLERYADLPVKSVLELGSGNSPHLEELLSRGYAYTGLDINEAMLEYSSQKASAIPGKATFVHADMNGFSLGETFDFAFIMLGSLSARNTEQVLSHLRSVAGALNKGGLYLLDWCVHFAPFSERTESWTMEQDRTKVNTRWSEKLVDAVEQLVEETFTLEAVEDGVVHHLSQTAVNRVIFPQEFLQLIERTGRFDFVGWWNNWDLDKPLGEVKDPQKISRPIALLRRV
jgi:SAM-dependent methyltransferase